MKGMENTFSDTEHNLPTCHLTSFSADLGDSLTDDSFDCQTHHCV